MSLSLRQKQSLYHSLSQLVRTGITFPLALDKLAPSMRGDARRLVESARMSLANGHTVGEAFAAQPSLVSPLEVSVISAVEKGGQLERGLRELSDYFGTMNQVRRDIIKRSAYPVFVLHFGIIILSVPTIFFKDIRQFWHELGTIFFFIYGVVIIIALATPLLRDAGAVNSLFDRLLNIIPVIGNVRRSFAMARFCTVYGLQLDAGINVIDSVMSAGRSSLSGMVQSAVDSAVPQIRTGAQVGPLLAASDAFPTDLTQAVIVGEETGSLDDELRRLGHEFRERGKTALEIFADWLPKLMYIATVVFLAWKIVSIYSTYMGFVKSLMN